MINWVEKRVHMSKAEKLLGKILELLTKDTRGLTIREISQECDVSRITASIALAKLDGAGRIIVREIGNCKLHYLKVTSHK